MQRNRYYEIALRKVIPPDSAILEKWYGMTEEFGYATGFKSFEDIRNRIECPSSPYEISSMVMLSGREKAVGFILGELKNLDRNKVFWIHIIIVDPDFQSCGLGTCVVNKILNYARHRYGASASLVSVSEKNKQGLSFFEKLGFIRCRSLENSLSTFGTTGVAIMKRMIQ